MNAAAQSDFDKTTSGIQENVGNQGGLSEEEEEQIGRLNQKLQQEINSFKVGRTSSGVSNPEPGNNRYSGSLEMHDDYAGVTYHTGASSGLESPMDDVATGGQNGSEAERQNALRENTRNAGNCTEGYIDGATDKDGDKIPCRNLSPILVDMGAAHGAAEDAHRVYQMTDEAKEAATKAGSDYATQVIQNATSTEFDAEAQQASQAVGATRTLSQNSDGSVTVTLEVNGESISAERNAKLDLLKSEVAWLEQQKAEYAERAWKTLRAARLAGIETDDYGQNSQITEFNSLVSNTAGQEDQDEQIARRIAEKAAYGNRTKFCMSADGTRGQIVEQGVTCPPVTIGSDQAARDQAKQALIAKAAQNGRVLSDFQATLLLNDLRDGEVSLKNAALLEKSQLVPTLYDQARQSNTDPAVQDEIAENVAKIVPCLDRNTWCWGADPGKGVRVSNQNNGQNGGGQNNANQNQKELYTDAAGSVDDPVGAVADDTREIIYANYANAIEGSFLGRLEATKNFDFNENTDSSTGATVFTEYKEEFETARRAYEASLDINQKYADNVPTEDSPNNGLAYGATGLVDVGYQNRFSEDNWNGNEQTFGELFGRNPDRDGTTIAGTGRGGEFYTGSIDFNPENVGSGGRGGSRGGARNSAPNQSFNPPAPGSLFDPTLGGGIF